MSIRHSNVNSHVKRNFRCMDVRASSKVDKGHSKWHLDNSTNKLNGFNFKRQSGRMDCKWNEQQQQSKIENFLGKVESALLHDPLRELKW